MDTFWTFKIEKRMQIIKKNDGDVVIEQNDSIGNKQMTFLSRKVYNNFKNINLNYLLVFI
jgi:hypothetical protein